MNRADDFERQLHSLEPATPADDGASVLYACGYAAGCNSVRNEVANGASRWQLVAAVLLASFLSGWGGYGMARRDLVEPQLASAPAETEQSPSVPTEQPSDPLPQNTETVMAVESDRSSEPAGSERMLHWLPLTLDRLLNPSGSPVLSGDENGVVLTARSGSADWTRWMEERPSTDRRSRNHTADESKSRIREEGIGDALTPMQWRHGDIDWEQWIH